MQLLHINVHLAVKELRVSEPDRPDCQSYTVHGIGNSQFVVTNHAENETSLVTE